MSNVPGGVVIHKIYLYMSNYAFDGSMKSSEGGLFDRRQRQGDECGGYGNKARAIVEIV